MSAAESGMYMPVRRYLESRNYSVYAEVKGCDIAAVKDSRIVIIELKTSLSLKLLIQGTERQTLTDSVYIAVPASKFEYTFRYRKSVLKLLKRLGLGLMLIHADRDNEVEIVLNPSYPPQIPSINGKKRRLLIKEIGGRYRDFNTAGSVSSVETVTAYRLKAVKIAVILKEKGPMSPAMLKKYGAPKETGSILYNNYYSWFERVERGIYRLSDSGITGLDNYSEAAEHFRNNLKNL